MKRLLHHVVGLATASVVSMGCSTPDDVSIGSPGQTTVGTSPAPAAQVPHSEKPAWACSRERRVEFFTDPVVHGTSVPLRSIASRVDGHAGFEIQREGRAATVTFLDRNGRIRHRFAYVRGGSWGWSLEQGESCRSAP